MTSLRDNLIKAAQVRLVKEAEARQESVAAAGELLIYAFKKAASNPLLVKRAKKEDDGVGSTGAYGTQSISHQSALPIGDRNTEFDPETQADLEAGEKRWIPNIFPSYADKPSGMMASPLKQGLLWAAPGGALGALGGGLAGALAGKVMGGMNPDARGRPDMSYRDTGLQYGAGVGGLAGAGLGGLIGAGSQQASNDTVKDLVSRLPKGARRRDIEADPLRRQEASDRAMATSSTPFNTILALRALEGLSKLSAAKGKPRTKRAAEGAAPIPMAPAGSHNIAMSKAGPVRGLMNMKRPLGGGSQAGGPSYGKAAIKNLPR